MIITPLPNVALNVGANRIVVGGGIPYPTGDPSLSASEERRYRSALVRQAVSLLNTPVAEQTIVTVKV